MQNQQDPYTKPEPSRQSGWEREIVEKLAFAAVKEQTRARRWNVFFKSLFFVYLFAIFGISISMATVVIIPPLLMLQALLLKIKTLTLPISSKA